MSEWISVKDRLPEEICVLVVLKTGTVTVGEYSEKSGDWLILDPFIIGCIDPIKYYYRPTHWMPLPEPPKEEK